MLEQLGVMNYIVWLNIASLIVITVYMTNNKALKSEDFAKIILMMTVLQLTLIAFAYLS